MSRIGLAFTGVLGLIMAVTDSAGAAVVAGFGVLALGVVALVLLVLWDTAPMRRDAQMAQDARALPASPVQAPVPARPPAALSAPPVHVITDAAESRGNRKDQP